MRMKKPPAIAGGFYLGYLIVKIKNPATRAGCFI